MVGMGLLSRGAGARPEKQREPGPHRVSAASPGGGYACSFSRLRRVAVDASRERGRFSTNCSVVQTSNPLVSATQGSPGSSGTKA